MGPGQGEFEEGLATIMEGSCWAPPLRSEEKARFCRHTLSLREYIDDRKWRQVVDDYLTRSSWVVILLQEMTPSLIYEIQRSLDFKSRLNLLLIPPPLPFRTAAWRRGLSAVASECPVLRRITDHTAAIIVDPREGTIEVRSEDASSANLQLTAIHRALVPKYLAS